MSLKFLMKKFTERLSALGEILSLRQMYIATISSFLYAGLARRSLLPSHGRLLRAQLLKHLPPPARATITHGQLYELALSIIKAIDKVISDKKTIELVEGKADIEFILKTLSQELGSIEYVVLYDCLSIPESITMASFLQVKNFEIIFPSIHLLNPIGLTRFITKQIPITKATMRDVLKVIITSLRAKDGSLIREVDQKVHSYGFDLGEFSKNVSIERVICACEQYAKKGSTLIVSDHGYDVLYDARGFYVSHGLASVCKTHQTVLNFSKISPIMMVFKR